ncbi:16295_t:CDS:1, partial [Gigaspora rosea]
AVTLPQPQTWSTLPQKWFSIHTFIEVQHSPPQARFASQQIRFRYILP